MEQQITTVDPKTFNHKYIQNPLNTVLDRKKHSDVYDHLS